MAYHIQLSNQQIDDAIHNGKKIGELAGILKGDGQNGFTAVEVDDAPEAASENLITSGAVQSAIEDSETDVKDWVEDKGYLTEETLPIWDGGYSDVN